MHETIQILNGTKTIHTDPGLHYEYLYSAF